MVLDALPADRPVSHPALLPPSQTDVRPATQPHATFSPPAEHFLGVGVPEHLALSLGGLPNLDADMGEDNVASLAAQMAALGLGAGKLRSPGAGTSGFGGFQPAQAEADTNEQPLSPGSSGAWSVLTSPKKEGAGGRRHRRSSSSIARELGVDQEMIRRVAEQLGIRS